VKYRTLANNNFCDLARRMPDLLQKIDDMLTEPEQAESILVLASKLATFAAENARKRNQESKTEIGKN
jgi:cytidylate kinase